MKHLWLLIPFVFIIIGCENDSIRSSDLISQIPVNASIIIKTKSIDGLKSVFKNNGLLSELLEYKAINSIQSQLHFLDYLKTTEDILLGFGKNANDSIQISLVTKYHKGLFDLDSVPNRTIETYTFNHLTISKTTLENRIFYTTIKDSIFFASNDRSLTEAAFNDKIVIDEALLDVYNTSGTNKSASVIINTKHKTLLPSFFMTRSMNNAQLTDYFLLDANLSQDEIIFNGITKAADSSKSLINIFKNTVPQENNLSKICPTDADGFLSFTFNNYKTFSENLFKFNKQDTLSTTSIFDTASEVGVIYRGFEQAIIVHSLDASAMGDLLLTQNALETFKDVAIYPYDQPELFVIHFSPLIDYKNASKYAAIDDYFIFSESDGLMKDIISNYQNMSTLSETEAFQGMMEQMSDESSLLFFTNPSRLNSILNYNFSEEKNLKLDAFRSSAIQFIKDNDFAHVNLVIKKSKGKNVANAVSEDISVKLDNDLLTDPHFVNNHTNKQMEIVVQDVKNNLYLITNDGKVLWKKQLEGRLLGKIKQIDMYKNGRLQLAFATPNRVYVLDRNGKDVSPFPLKFKDNITQPLSVFDYEGKRDYRLMVIQGKSVLMYDVQGKTVSGFSYKKADNTINTQPQHFKIGRKDYIVFVQGNELAILDRTGKTRVTVKNNIAFSGNEIHLYENNFTATTVDGDLIQIDENGKMSSLNLNLGEKHAMTSTSKTLVTLSDNILSIKGNKIEMDYGVYTSPNIFYLKDKIYVSVTDLQTKKIYMYDSLGKAISNFPVYGNSAIDLGNIDNVKGLEFVTKGDSNSILIYEMN